MGRNSCSSSKLNMTVFNERINSWSFLLFLISQHFIINIPLPLSLNNLSFFAETFGKFDFGAKSAPQMKWRKKKLSSMPMPNLVLSFRHPIITFESNFAIIAIINVWGVAHHWRILFFERRGWWKNAAARSLSRIYHIFVEML